MIISGLALMNVAFNRFGNDLYFLDRDIEDNVESQSDKIISGYKVCVSKKVIGLISFDGLQSRHGQFFAFFLELLDYKWDVRVF